MNFDWLLSKSVTVKVSLRRIIIFIILMLGSLDGVVYWILLTSCNYPSEEYFDHCDPVIIQRNQPLTLCRHSIPNCVRNYDYCTNITQICGSTFFYSNFSGPYYGDIFQNCSAKLYRLSAIVMRSGSTITAINSEIYITCGNRQFFTKEIFSNIAFYNWEATPGFSESEYSKYESRSSCNLIMQPDFICFNHIAYFG